MKKKIGENKYNLEHLGMFQDWNDGTIKGVYQGEKGVIEVTFIKNKKDRGTDVYCVPTHHYCNLGCKMCHLTVEGSHKVMVPIQKEGFIEALVRTTFIGGDEEREKRSFYKKGWIAFMGVGEPLLNLGLIKKVFESEEEIKQRCQYNEITYAISTMMPNKNLVQLTDYVCKNKMPLKIHFSLHTPFSEERFDLLPKTRVNVKEAFTLLTNYRTRLQESKEIVSKLLRFHSDQDPTEIHYTLIKGLNDSNRHLEEMVELTKEFKIPIKFIIFNPTKELKKSKNLDNWLKRLNLECPDVKIKFYYPPGKEIGSSCGEFTKHYYLSELETTKDQREFEDWKLKHQIFE